MKYEVFLVRYGSVIVEAENKNEAKKVVCNMTDEEIDKSIYSESAWEMEGFCDPEEGFSETI